ncbi:hypothetical protein ACOSP7_026729 [Xanthoceras sorbifolium]
MELGVNDKLHHLEIAISKISEVLTTRQETIASNINERSGRSSIGHARENTEGGRPMFFSKLAKLEFPKYAGDDLTEWFMLVDQFFEYQGTLENQKVPLASFYLEGEANQWWQWLRRAYHEEGNESRFGPTDCEDFDEALSKIRQSGSLRDYQKEFEKLGNRVQGWTQKALVRTFMGGLKAEIADGIKMFKPKSLKEAISLARMRDEQLIRQRKFHWNNKIQKLQGIDAQAIQPVSVKVITKEAQQGGSIFAISFQTTSNPTLQSIDPEMKQLLEKFEEVFQEPTQLLPTSRSSHQFERRYRSHQCETLQVCLISKS